MRAVVDRRSSPGAVSAGELRHALARDELVVYFQPQIDLVSEVVSASRRSCAGSTRSAASLPPLEVVADAASMALGRTEADSTPRFTR